MSQPLVMIAIGVAGFTVGRLSAYLLIRRLRIALTSAAWHLAHDSLTGLLNRDGLLTVHAEHTADSHGSQPIIAILLDLDDFKSINDSYRHDTGNQLLTIVARRIDETAALFDGVAARLSGDEYAVLLSADRHDPARVADMFVTVIAQPAELTYDGHPLIVTTTASVGVAVAVATDPIADVLLHRADIAMYHAKHHGGNTFAIYQPGMDMPTGTSQPGARRRDRRERRGGAA